jgi:hypothetical protein
MTAESRPPPSLQELCEIKLRDVLLSSDTADEDFASFEPRIQSLVFHGLRAEHARLRDIGAKL